jgi:NADH dehydrogenase/NADH:ubiquinone oxidoreductase subunit G
VIGKEFAAKENMDQLRRTIEFARGINAKVVVLKGNTNSFAAAIYGLTLRPELKGSAVAFYALGDGKVCPQALEALKASGYKVVQSSYCNEATALADIVLPCKIWNEEEGHYLTTDGRLELNRVAIVADEQQRSVLEVLNNLSEKSGISLNADWQKELTDKISSIVLA